MRTPATRAAAVAAGTAGSDIFKLDYGITDALEQANYWSRRRFPWHIDVQPGQDTAFMIGGAVAIVALLLSGFMLTVGAALGVGGGLRSGRNCNQLVDLAHQPVDHAGSLSGERLDGNRTRARAAAANLGGRTGSTGSRDEGVTRICRPIE